MYHIMIIDDNYLSVDGICHNIKWSALNAEVSYKAYNGLFALEQLAKNPVDLIISDIEMPQLDGLELARRALHTNPNIKIILISAFDKFEYAKQAVRLGAFDYVEKPLDYSYLTEIIRKALNTIEREQKNLQILKHSRPVMTDNFFLELIHSSSDEAQFILKNYPDFLNLKLDYRFFQTAIIQIENDRLLKDRLGLEEYHIRMLDLADTIREIFSRKFSLVHIITNFNKLIVILAKDYTDKKQFQTISAELFNQLSESYRENLFNLNIGIGTAIRHLQNLSSSYENAAKALEYSFFFPQKNIFDIRDTMGSQIPPEISLGNNQEEQLIQLICVRDLQAIHAWIQDFSKLLLENYRIKQFIFIRVYLLLGRLLRFSYEMNIDVRETEQEIIELYSHIDTVSSGSVIFNHLYRICCDICKKLDTSAKNHHEHICAATVEYISRHYGDVSLCLNDIAEHVNVSPAYLSALFKKTQKENISDIITNIRIDAACQQLCTSTASLKEISCNVGYANQYYFSSCFKKKIGMTPSAYREIHSHM